MAKHTKGPWSISGGVGFPDHPPRRTRAIYGPTEPGNQSGYHVADARGPNADINARLIAAAPELLDACVLALDRLWTHDRTALDIPDAREISRKLEAAIAKATGGDNE